MAYVVLARKYRPARFEDFVGQEAIATTLRNAIATDRVHHAYLFCGPRGIGKTSMARVFAMALNCAKGPTADPCRECTNCLAIQAGEDMDVLELDGASNRGIDQVRDIRANVQYAPARSRYKIYYIDEAHMLTPEAFNALLKTLEEPPPHVKFILSTTEPTKMPETIHSRCQRLDFRRISAFAIADRLAQICKDENVKVGRDVLMRIGRYARGGMRDALSLLDQLIAFCGEKIGIDELNRVLGASGEEDIEKLVDALRRHDAAEALRLGGQLLDAGKEVPDLFDQLAGYLRDLLVAGQCGADVHLLEQPEDTAKHLVEMSKGFTPETLMYMIQVTTEARRRARGELDPRIVLEMTLVKLARTPDLRPLDELTSRLEALENRGGSAPASAPATPSSSSRPAPVRPPRAAAPVREAAPLRSDEPPLSEAEEMEASYGDAEIVSPAAPVATGAPEEEDVWHRFLQFMQKRSFGLSIQLGTCRYLGSKGNTARIGLPPDTGLAQDALDKPQTHRILEECFSAAFGRPMKVAVERTAATTDALDLDAAKKNPIVKKALETLDGKIIDVEVA